MHVHRQLTAQQTQPSASIYPSLPLDLFCGMLIITALCQWANRLSVTCALGLATYIFINPHPSSTMFIPILFTSSLGYFSQQVGTPRLFIHVAIFMATSYTPGFFLADCLRLLKRFVVGKRVGNPFPQVPTVNPAAALNTAYVVSPCFPITATWRQFLSKSA